MPDIFLKKFKDGYYIFVRRGKEIFVVLVQVQTEEEAERIIDNLLLFKRMTND